MNSKFPSFGKDFGSSVKSLHGRLFTAVFSAIRKDLEEATRRLIHITAAAKELSLLIARIRLVLVKNAGGLTADHVRSIESEIQSASHLISIAQTSATGVSSKVYSAQWMVSKGITLEGSAPYCPSMN